MKERGNMRGEVAISSVVYASSTFDDEDVKRRAHGFVSVTEKHR